MLFRSAFSDHYAYRREDLDRIRTQVARSNAEMVLTTEKDAGKLAPLLRPDESWWALRLRADVRRGQDALHRLICGFSAGPKKHGDGRA